MGLDDDLSNPTEMRCSVGGSDMVSPSLLLIFAVVGFAVAAVASIGLQFGRHSRTLTYSLAVGLFLGIISVGAQVLINETAPSEEEEESFIGSLLTKR